MTIEAYAKVNLTLEVYGNRPDGFHELKSIVQPIMLADTLTFTPADEFSTDTGYPDDLILKAVNAMLGFRPLASSFQPCHIAVAKRIPAGGGLGGGSADAAATLLALNALWKLALSPERLAEIGAQVGSDVPALVLAQHYRGPVRMEGRGERVTPMAPQPIGEFMVLANPGVHSSTAEVYAKCEVRERPADGMVNDLQAAACALHPEIATALATLKMFGADGVMMSGSGSTVFGFADSRTDALAIADKMRAIGCTAFVTSPLK